MSERTGEQTKQDKITITMEQLSKFYLQAYNDGRDAKNVCGGLSKLSSVSATRMVPALLKAYAKD